MYIYMRVLVHFYLFTEGYFQYTVVQLYFVEICYIEHIEARGEIVGKNGFQVEEMKKEANASGTNHDHTSLLSFLQRKSKCLVLPMFLLPLSQIYLHNPHVNRSW